LERNVFESPRLGTLIDPHAFLTDAFKAGVAAADPRAATRQAVLKRLPFDLPVWVIAVGKGAHAMASGAVDVLHEHHVPVAGGLVVANTADPSATHGLRSVDGDHPTPGRGSFAAADQLAELTERTTADADAIVLVSGGATSLIAAPLAPITEEELTRSFDALLASGADISLMNAVRKRLLRFGAGRLALALGTRRIVCLIASDVVGNDLASIASGPCVPDRGSARHTQRLLRELGAWDALPLGVRHYLEAMTDGRVPDVPAADHPRFASTHVEIILDRTDAERGAAEFARTVGASVEVLPAPLTGDATRAARQFVASLLERQPKSMHCVITSGETTVTLGADAGRGGRCQEFALTSAIELERTPGITVLAAGTDGRDGPTDAAGAIVDSDTTRRIHASGIDPQNALRTHASYNALDAAGALLKTGATGTNVNDLVIALVSVRHP
jgi:glycerate 2-kinase